MKTLKYIISFTLIICILCLQINAVTLQNQGYYQKTIFVKNSATGYFYNVVNEAISNWNSTGIAPRSIVKDTTASSRIYDDSFTHESIVRYSNKYGLYYMYSSTNNCTCHTTLVFYIYLNRNLLTEEIAASTAAHELGHAFGLDDEDNPQSNTNALMNFYRDRRTRVSPTAAEATAVVNHWNRNH